MSSVKYNNLQTLETEVSKFFLKSFWRYRGLNSVDAPHPINTQLPCCRETLPFSYRDYIKIFYIRIVYMYIYPSYFRKWSTEITLRGRKKTRILFLQRIVKVCTGQIFGSARLTKIQKRLFLKKKHSSPRHRFYFLLIFSYYCSLLTRLYIYIYYYNASYADFRTFFSFFLFCRRRNVNVWCQTCEPLYSAKC